MYSSCSLLWTCVSSEIVQRLWNYLLVTYSMYIFLLDTYYMNNFGSWFNIYLVYQYIFEVELSVCLWLCCFNHKFFSSIVQYISLYFHTTISEIKKCYCVFDTSTVHKLFDIKTFYENEPYKMILPHFGWSNTAMNF